MNMVPKINIEQKNLPSLTSEECLRIYFTMCLTREFENTILSLYRQGKIVGGAYTGNGNEATSVASAFCLRHEDYLFPMHRDMGAHLMKGQSVKQLLLQHLARENSLTHGRDGTGHYADPSLRIYGNISHLASMIPVAAGVALASKIKKEHAVVLTYIGDGGSNVGDFHESLAMASVMHLPLILILENNQYAYSTPVAKQFVGEKYSDRAHGYGIPGTTIDGTDVHQVYTAVRNAVERARSGAGPSLIESVTMRMHGHSAHDTADYVPKNLIEEWKKKDPLELFRKNLIEKKILTPEVDESYRKKISEELHTASAEALAEGYPSGENAAAGVFARSSNS
jgi:TPP-dependent pyruvate/acetoin dehydrogenase alpha subunit